MVNLTLKSKKEKIMGIETAGQIIINSKNSEVNNYISALSESTKNGGLISLDLMPAEEHELPFITGFCEGEFGPSFNYYGRKSSEYTGLNNLISKLTKLDPKVRLLVTKIYDCDFESTYVEVYFGSKCVENHKVFTNPIFSGLDTFYNPNLN